VLVSCLGGIGPLVTTANLEQMRQEHFGLRCAQGPVSVEALQREIARYDPQDAAEVSRRVCAEAGRDGVIDRLVPLYKEIIVEQASARPRERDDEMRAAAAYIRRLGTLAKRADYSMGSLTKHWLGAAADLRRLCRLSLVSLGNRLSRIPALGRLAGPFARLLRTRGTYDIRF
jgi:hypothetical protein